MTVVQPAHREPFEPPSVSDPAAPSGDGGGPLPGLPLEAVRRPLRTTRVTSRRPARKWLGVAVISLVLIGGVLFGRKRLSASASTAVPATSAKARTDQVVGLGTILPAGGVVTVATPYGAGDARVAVLKVEEGDRVERGALLAVLDNERTLLSAIEAAKAGVRVRTASRRQVTSFVRASRAELSAQLARANVAARSAARESDRSKALWESGAISKQAYDQRRTARDEAAREVERVRAAMSRFGRGSVYAQADAVVAGRNVDSAKVELARAKSDLARAHVRAPIAGTVLTVHADPGERPGSQGILTMGNLEQMTIEVDVYQTHIGRVAIGDAVTASAPALDRALIGRVSKIGLEVGRQQTMDPNPAANTDARVVKVTVTLDAPSSVIARRFTNLQVTAAFTSRSGDG